jgi:hypothetical protein
MALLFSKNCGPENIKDRSIWKNMYETLDYFGKNMKDDIPISIKTKFEFIKQASKLISEKQSSEYVLFDDLDLNKYSKMTELVDGYSDKNLPPHHLERYQQQVIKRRKLSFAMDYYAKLEKTINDVKTESYSDLDEIIERFESDVSHTYGQISKLKNEESLAKGTEVTIGTHGEEGSKISFKEILENIKSQYDPKNLLPTGFDFLDNHILHGGLEKKRLYIWAGGSGSGKSTLIANIMERSIPKLKQSRDTNVRKYYIYVTLENLVEETLCRLYQSICRKTVDGLLEDFNKNGVDYLEKQINDYFGQANVSLELKYRPKFSITPDNINDIIVDMKHKYRAYTDPETGEEVPEGELLGVFIDYLDLLTINSSINTFDLYRLELSRIASSFKDIAVFYNIPVVTITQLNREVYSMDSGAKGLHLGMIGEAMKKVDHADFIAIMAKDQTVDHIVYMNVRKNRGGMVNVAMECAIDFSQYRFNDIKEAVNSERSQSNDHLMNFNFDTPTVDLGLSTF